MSNSVSSAENNSIDDLYAEAGHWHINTGDETIHAKRLPGRFRTYKWLGHSLYLLFFLGPYLRWEGSQAILYDIPGRQFHFFDLTIFPQDVWILSLVLMFFAILMVVVTAIVGRLWCGYFCFQTAWMDVFTWIEGKLEGEPAKRRKLDDASWTAEKIRKRGIKHSLWLLISVLTGISFTAWFMDAFQLWNGLFSLDVPFMAWVTIGTFTAGTYILAGFMREQVCLWLCPYARIQGVFYDRDTELPTYDFNRGEPRGKIRKGESSEGKGDCIDCNQCVAVCPTGIDIREGQQEGCITCGLCIDACDMVMGKVGKPSGLVRYASLDEIEGKAVPAILKRPRVVVSFALITLMVSGIIYGLTHLGSLELKVLHERQPLYVQQSDGTIQNKYYFKMLNKTDKEMQVKITVDESINGLKIIGAEKSISVHSGDLRSHTIFVKVPNGFVSASRLPVTFHLTDVNNPETTVSYESMFFGPKR